MILKNFKGFLTFLFFVTLTLTSKSDEKIDIWKNNNTGNSNKESTEIQKIKKEKIKVQNSNERKIQIKIENELIDNSNEIQIFGVYDPEENNFDLNMWSNTNAEDVRASIKRLKKINLSKTSSEILENILLSYSYPPEGMGEKEFLQLKINWLIENNRSDLLEEFLKQNKEFEGKSSAIQYLVDKNIAQANIKRGCEKIKFIDSSLKDSYLEKFKIYCLIFDNKKSQAQLLLDLLREQKQSDKFFDDKVNYLLGISEKTSQKINEKNLLNFYLSSITIKDFNYSPSSTTKKEIWEYLNAANLIKIDDINDKGKIKDLELAASNGQLNKEIIFNIYRQKEFSLNTLINAKNSFQSLDRIDARSLIYQKYLLSEDVNSKVEYLFLLEELFKKDDLLNVYSNFLSDNLKNLGLENISEKYKEIAENRILLNEEQSFGKVKYNDKILHQSKIIKYYIENEEAKKVQKDIDRIFKKISKNRKYFFSAKDLALVDALLKDGFKIPENFEKKELSLKYDIPKNLVSLIEKKQNAFLALKIVEIIGEDEPHQLDPETIYFITNLLNETNLIKIRNKVLISALPQRV